MVIDINMRKKIMYGREVKRTSSGQEQEIMIIQILYSQIFNNGDTVINSSIYYIDTSDENYTFYTTIVANPKQMTELNNFLLKKKRHFNVVRLTLLTF